MNRETYDALVASVEKWRENACGPSHEAKTGNINCPLCNLFHRADTLLSRACVGCPVRDATGMRYCMETPYRLALAATYSDDEGRWRAAAQREADFLAALVPAGGPDE